MFFPSEAPIEDCTVISLALEHTFLIINILILVSFTVWISWELSTSSPSSFFLNFSLNVSLSFCILLCKQREGNRTHPSIISLEISSIKYPSLLLTHSVFYITVGNNWTMLSATTLQGSSFFQFLITCSSFPSEPSPIVLLMSVFLEIVCLWWFKYSLRHYTFSLPYSSLPSVHSLAESLTPKYLATVYSRQCFFFPVTVLKIL